MQTLSDYSGQLLSTAEGHAAPIKDVAWIVPDGEYYNILVLDCMSVDGDSSYYNYVFSFPLCI